MSSNGNLEDQDYLLGGGSNGGWDEELAENDNTNQATWSVSIPGDIEMQNWEATHSSEDSQAQTNSDTSYTRSMGRRMHGVDILPRCPNGPLGEIDKQLMEAAISGDLRLLRDSWRKSHDNLFQSTPQGNNCAHIAALYGQHEFFIAAWAMEKPLLAAVNNNGQTPLIVAVINGFPGFASDTISYSSGHPGLKEALLTADDAGYNILHHAIKCGYKELALELIMEAPELSKAKSKLDESAMYVAVLKDYREIFEKLILIPESSDSGQQGNNALHAAVKNGNKGIVKAIMEHRPSMATIETTAGATPVRLSVITGRTEVLRVFLKTDFLLGYQISSTGLPLLISAARRGMIDAAREVLLNCPDAPYQDNSTGYTCLHEAVLSEHEEFLKFIIKAPQLRALVNMRDNLGKTALHIAVQKCRPRLVDTILSHKDIDISILDEDGRSAAWELRYAFTEAKTLEWNEICMLLSNADPRDISSINYLQKEARINAVNASRLDSKALSEMHMSNTAIVAILIATITFAAGFTMPGGYSSNPAIEGQPVFSRSPSLVAFLISDTMAMCSSFIVAFLCIISRWGDYRFLVHYKAVTNLLLWIAYISTIVAFATGLFTVLASPLLWLGILICCAGAILPVATKLVGEWPILRLKLRIRRSTYRGQLLDIV